MRRRRNGLIDLSVMGLLLCERKVGEPNLNTGQALPVSAQLPPTAAENYRESGLVPRVTSDIWAQVLTGNMFQVDPFGPFLAEPEGVIRSTFSG